MNENTTEPQEQPSVASLQALVDYYRNRASQLEFEFLQYQLAAQATIQELSEQLEGHLSANPDTKENPTK